LFLLTFNTVHNCHHRLLDQCLSFNLRILLSHFVFQFGNPLFSTIFRHFSKITFTQTIVVNLGQLATVLLLSCLFDLCLQGSSTLLLVRLLRFVRHHISYLLLLCSLLNFLLLRGALIRLRSRLICGSRFGSFTLCNIRHSRTIRVLHSLY
jgi:hypothetical protein